MKKILILMLFLVVFITSCEDKTPRIEGAETGEIQKSEVGYVFEPYQKADLSSKATDIKNLYYTLYNNHIPMLYVKLPDKNTSFGIENDYTRENLEIVDYLIETELIDCLDLSRIFENSPEDYFYKNGNAIKPEGNLEIMKQIVNLIPDYYSLLLDGSAVDNNSYYKTIAVPGEEEDSFFYAPAEDYEYRTRYYNEQDGNIPAVTGTYEEIVLNKLEFNQMTMNITCDNNYGKGTSVIVVHNLDDLSILAMFADNFERVIAYDVRNFTGESLVSVINSSSSYQLCITLLNPNGSYPAFHKETRDVVNSDYEVVAAMGYLPIKDNHRKLQVVYDDVDVTVFIKNMVELRDTLAAKGTDLMFVQAPVRGLKGVTVYPPGIHDYTNDTSDKFLADLAENNVNYVDLRIDIVKELPHDEIFYKTDHHWKVESAFWAYTKIINMMRDDWGWDVNPGNKNTDKENFTWELRKHTFFSHLGMHYHQNFVGIDDFMLIYPKDNANTSFKTTIDRSGKLQIRKGTFYDAIFDQDLLTPEDPTTYRYCSYVSFDEPLVILENFGEGVSDKKVLIVKDSFSIPFNAFMALNFRRLEIYDVRFYTLSTLTEYATKNDFDLVMFLYNPTIFKLVPTMFKFK